VPDPTRLAVNASGAAAIELPPLSYAFVVFDGVRAPACTWLILGDCHLLFSIVF
jgi:hypothetical protein